MAQSRACLPPISLASAATLLSPIGARPLGRSGRPPRVRAVRRVGEGGGTTRWRPFRTPSDATPPPGAPPADTIRPRSDTLRRRAPGDSARAPTDSAGNLAGGAPARLRELDLRLSSRLEAKGEQVRNDRCGSSQLFATAFSVPRRLPADVRLPVQPAHPRHGRRAHPRRRRLRHAARVRRVEQHLRPVRGEGQRAPAAPRGRATSRSRRRRRASSPSGIPSGNYGVQAHGPLGRHALRARSPRSRRGTSSRIVEFVVGDRTVQQQTRRHRGLSDRAAALLLHGRPARVRAGYPNVDILDRRQLSRSPRRCRIPSGRRRSSSTACCSADSHGIPTGRSSASSVTRRRSADRCTSCCASASTTTSTRRCSGSRSSRR